MDPVSTELAPDTSETVKVWFIGIMFIPVFVNLGERAQTELESKNQVLGCIILLKQIFCSSSVGNILILGINGAHQSSHAQKKTKFMKMYIPKVITIKMDSPTWLNKNIVS